MRHEFDWDTCRGAGFEEAMVRADACLRRVEAQPAGRAEAARAPVVLPVDYQIPTFLRRGYRRPD